MYYSEDLVEEIRSRNDIVDVIGSYVKLQKKGSSYFGLCPFHNEKSPSFSVSPAKQMYYCFGCGAGGNVFTFVMAYENYSFVEALQHLAERVGMKLPENEMTEEQKLKQNRKQVLLEINKIAAKYFYYQLNGERGSAAKAYLEKRCLSKETVIKFGLGFSNPYSDDLYKYLRELGYKDGILKDTGLVNLDEKHGGTDKFWNRLMFPIMDVNSKVIGFGGRVLGDGMPKYLNSPETPLFDKSRNLYGLNLARTSRKSYMIICEGYMDVIAMHQAGFNNAVASLGTAFTMQQAALLKRYTDEVCLAYDSDGAGVKAALRAIPILKDAGLSTKIIHMDPYKDPDEFIKNMGCEAFEERISSAQNSFMFEVSILEKSYNLNEPEGKTNFYRETAKKLLIFEQELERNNYIEAIARQYHIAYEDLKKLVNQMGLSMESRPVPIPQSTKENKKTQKDKEDSMLLSQKLLLTWLIEDVSLFKKIIPYITPKDFIEPIYHQVAQMVFGEYEKTGQVTPARIINQFEDKEEQTKVAALFNTTLKGDLDQAAKEKALNETVLKIKKSSIEYASRHAVDMKDLQDIIKAKAELQKLHISL